MAAIELWQGDITTLKVDVVVNAANNGLHEGGVHSRYLGRRKGGGG